ncbi:MAG: folate-binding protein YgfZ [Gammaproteobacteria bacterium]|nr:folate-binding protein YgfZ [Gammaproteobacteria bacterium]
MSMPEAWRNFIQNQGANLLDAYVLGFQDPAHECALGATNDILMDLSHYPLLRAKGDEAQSFLHGQLTNDLQALDAHHMQLQAYCSPKGRVISIMHVLRDGDDFLLQISDALLKSTQQRLQMYMLRAQLTLNHDSDIVAVGIAGPSAKTKLQAVFGLPPGEVYQVTQHDTVKLIRMPGTVPRFQLIGPIEKMTEYWLKLAAHFTSVGSHRWAWLTIAAGQPSLYPATQDQFIPQMLNLDLVGGLNFKKGCYPGQEIVARTHYLGKLKQRMVRANLKSDNLPLPGERLFAANNNNQSVGQVVDAQASPQGGFDLLAVVRTATLADGPLLLGAGDNNAVSLLDLPYSLDKPAS